MELCISFVQELHQLVVGTLSVKSNVLKRDKAVGLVARTNLFISGFAVKEHESAADLFEDHTYFRDCDGKDIFQMNRVFIDGVVFANLTDQIADYFVFLKEKTC